MAKDVAIGKKATISKAQQTTLLVVLGASVVLGIATSLTIHFIKQITFNAEVISKEDESIVAYSNAIKNTGVCLAPSGEVYSDKELADCNPGTIDVSEIPDTLRANVLKNMAGNQALNSVPNNSNAECINPATKKQFTYQEMDNIYSEAKQAKDEAERAEDKEKGIEQLNQATQLIKKCSALRIIPDALPALKNEEALLASLNKLFDASGWSPETLSPAGEAVDMSLPAGLNALSVNLSVKTDSSTTMNVLHNIERSIREFNIKKATIEWGSDNSLHLQAQAAAYYMNESKVLESTTTISTEGR